VVSGGITTILVNGTDNVTFKNVDFSTNGGAILYFNNSNNGIVTDCKFAAITNTDLINSNASGLTVTNCSIDGLGGTYNGSGVIGAYGGNVNIEYNLLENFPQHAVELGGNGLGVNLT